MSRSPFHFIPLLRSSARPALILSLVLATAPALCAGLFTDVSSSVGLIREAKKSWGSPIWGDLNNDGFLDLIIPTHGIASSGGPFVYLNQNGTSFKDIRATCGIGQAATLDDGDWHGLAVADYNGDGNLDVYISEGAKGKTGGTIKRDLLFRGNGDGTFDDVSGVVGLEVNSDRGRGGTWFDFDNDGRVDLFTKNYDGTNVLYRNTGAGRLVPVANDGDLDTATFGIGFGSIVALADYDNDGFVDLSITGDGNTQEIYHNEGNGTFSNSSRSIGIQPHINAKGAAWGDYNNDGFPDLFVARAHQGLTGSGSSLYLNDGTGHFTDVTDDSGVGIQGNCWAAVWGDYDNDGRLDLFVTNSGDLGQGPGNANRLFHNNGDGTFADVAATEGVQMANGVSLHKTAAWGDYNNDGFLDLVVKDGVGGEEDNGNGATGLHYLFKNKGNANHFIKVKLRGIQSNLLGLGARVTVTSSNGKAYWQNFGGGGGNYTSQSSEPLHFGLGAATSASVLVEWPSGLTSQVDRILAGRTVTISEGDQPPPVNAENLSTRIDVKTGSKVGIGGFIVTGTGTTQVLVRGLGPSLAGGGVQGALLDPVLELHSPDGTIQTNDNWRDTQAAKISAADLAPTNDLEAAIVTTVAPGAYTAVLTGRNLTSGIGAVEIYNLDPLGAQLGNVSSRGFVGTGENVLIGGVIIGPHDAGSATLVVRAIGPSLTGLGIAGALGNPTLELHNANGAVIGFNDNWKDDPGQSALLQGVGLNPKNPNESAILLTAAPGAYTAIVAGKSGGTGLALVEVYHVD